MRRRVACWLRRIAARIDGEPSRVVVKIHAEKIAEALKPFEPKGFA